MDGNGFLVVISAPSGGGKTTILKRVLEQGSDDFRYSISATTRPQRPGEIHGRDYYFLTLEEFERKREQGEFAEWAEVHGNFYATPKSPIKKWLTEDRIVLCDLDVDGGLAVKRIFGETALLLFVRPPSLECLFERLRLRNTESDSEIRKRLERYPKEMAKAEHYDRQIINEDIEQTVQRVLQIIKERRLAI